MQTFSNMRRSRFNYPPLVLLLLFPLAIVYESIGMIYPYLAPLLGVGFYYWTQHVTDKKRYLTFVLFFSYTLFLELDRGLILFSFILLSVLYYFLLYNLIEDTLNCHVCKIIIKVFYSYLGYYGINFFLAFLFNLPFPEFSGIYFVYIFTDFLLVVLFL